MKKRSKGHCKTRASRDFSLAIIAVARTETNNDQNWFAPPHLLALASALIKCDTIISSQLILSCKELSGAQVTQGIIDRGSIALADHSLEIQNGSLSCY